MDQPNREDMPVQNDEEADRSDEAEEVAWDDLNHIPDFEEIERHHSRKASMQV